MKSGAGDDPFAERGQDTDDRDDTDRTDGGPEQGQSDERGDTTGETTAPGEPDETVAGGLLGGDATGDESGSPLDAAEIPWVLRRGSVKDDRPNVTQFFLRDETDRAEQRLKTDVEERLDRDVYTLDLREAAYRIAMRHPDEIAEELRAWGYDYLD